MSTEQSLWQSIAPSIVTGMTGLAGAFIGAWLAGVRETRQAKRQDSRDALYLAVTLGAHLRQVVGQCVAVAHDDGTNEFGEPSQRTKDGEPYYSPTTTKPSLRIPDLDVEWKVLPPSVLDELFALHLVQEDIDADISGASQFAYPPDYDDLFAARQFGYAKLGLRVLSVCEALRAHVGLPPNPEPHIGFTTKQSLQKVVHDFEANRAAIAAENPDDPGFSVEGQDPR